MLKLVPTQDKLAPTQDKLVSILSVAGNFTSLELSVLEDSMSSNR